MQDKSPPTPQIKVNRWRRFADWDERPLRLDKFAVEDAAAGFAAFSSPNDPKPGLEIANGKRQVDGRHRRRRFRHDRSLHRQPSSRSRHRRRGDGDPLARVRAHAGRHERAARQAGAPRPRHDAGQAGRGGDRAERARDRLRLLQDARPPYARQPGARHQRQGRPAAAGGRCGDRRRLRLRRDRDDHAGRAQRLVQRRRLRGRRRGRALRAPCSSAPARRPKSCRSAWPASPPMPRPCPSTAPSAPSSTATTRPGPRRSCPPPMPRAASRCAAPRAQAPSC